MSLRVLSYNIRGIGNLQKCREIFIFLCDKQVDIILLQETHSIKNCEKIWRNEWGGKMLFSHGQSNSKGVAILFKPGTKIIINNVLRDNEGHQLIVQIQHDEFTITLANIYVPNKDEPAFFVSVFKNLEEFDIVNLILGGDFNLALDMARDKRLIEHNNDKVCLTLNELIEQFMLADSWRVKNIDLFQFTWRHNTQTLVFARLDYFSIPQGLVGSVNDVQIMPSFRSDHNPILIEQELNTVERGLGFWKFNVSHLEMQSYRDKLQIVTDDTITNKLDTQMDPYQK